jgi:hypothetical protein
MNDSHVFHASLSNYALIRWYVKHSKTILYNNAIMIFSNFETGFIVILKIISKLNNKRCNIGIIQINFVMYREYHFN